MELTSRPATPITRPNRNFLFPHEQKVVDHYRNMVARELQQWISETDKELIKCTPKDEVCVLHHSLGRAVRNEYELWMPEHDVTAIYHLCEKEFPLADQPSNSPETMLYKGKTIQILSSSPHIEDHPCFPDNFSMSCIEQLWENLQ